MEPFKRKQQYDEQEPRQQEERIHRVKFHGLSIGRHFRKVKGCLFVHQHYIEFRVFNSKPGCSIPSNIMPTKCLTGLDLQLQGLSEGTSHLPLSAKLSMEFSTSVCIRMNDREFTSMLISIHFDLQHTNDVRLMVQQLQSLEYRAIHKGLPSWAPFIPSYSPSIRKFIQSAIFIWTIFSIVWAMWQLYQHFQLFRQVLEYARQVLRSQFRPIHDILLYVFAHIEPFTSPLHLFFVTVSTPLFQALSIWRKIGELLWSVIQHSFFGPLGYFILLLWKSVFQPFQLVWQYLLSAPCMLFYDCIRIPTVVLWTGVIQPMYNLLIPPITNLMSRASVFEFDTQRERIAKIHRIATNNARTLALGLKNLMPNLLGAKKNIEDNFDEVKKKVLLKKHRMIPSPRDYQQIFKNHEDPDIDISKLLSSRQALNLRKRKSSAIVDYES